MAGWNKARTKDGKTIYWLTPTLPSWALPELTVEEVVQEWVNLGGTEEQFDAKIQNDWNLTREQLKSNHLTGLMQLLNRKRAS
jgi:hypothetical protein